MTYRLKQNDIEIASSFGWNPRLFGSFTGTSYPKEVGIDYVWQQDGWILSWEIDPSPTPTTLNDLKTAKRNSINEIRSDMETSGFMYLDKLFDSDQRSADRIQVAAIAAQSALMAGQPFSLDWTTADNSIVTLDAAGILGMIGAFASRGLALHETAKALKAQADSATTKEELDTIVWPV